MTAQPTHSLAYVPKKQDLTIGASELFLSLERKAGY